MSPDDLVQIEAIKRLKYAYARLLDTKDWSALSELFVPDATAAYGGGQYSFEGRDAIMDFLRGALDRPEVLTSHVMGQPEIELTGPTTATGVWGLQDEVIFTEGSVTVRGASFYTDAYVKVDERWRFRHTGYKRVWEEMVPRDPRAKLTASWFSTDGISTLGA